MGFIQSFYNLYISPDKQFARRLKNLLGFAPGKLIMYKTAFTHSSSSSEVGENNERLELLGDAVLGLLVLDMLYHRFPFRGEGFLSEMRSKIVSRTQLNELATKMGLSELLDSNLPDHALYKSATVGNALEALIGAVYLDKGYRKAAWFTREKILKAHYDVEHFVEKVVNFKSKIIHYAQKHGHAISFQKIGETNTARGKLFEMSVMINGEQLATAEDFNKKRAEQEASRLALLSLDDQETD